MASEVCLIADRRLPIEYTFSGKSALRPSPFRTCMYKILETKKPDLFDRAFHIEHILYSAETTEFVLDII